MDRRAFLRCAGFATAALAAHARGQERSVRDLADQLEAIRREHGLPGIAAAAVRGDSVVAEGVAGIRAVGAVEKIMLDDRFALDSGAKRMTAAMLGRVI